MLVPARLRVLGLIAATAICSLTAQPAHAGDQPLTPQQYEEMIKQGYSVKVIDSYSKQSAGATGPTAEATGDQTAQEVAGTAPDITLPGGIAAKGGDTNAKQKAKVEAPPWAAIAIGICGVGLIVAAALKIRPPAPELDTAAALAGAGVLCVVIAVMPELLFLLFIAAVVVAIPHFLPDKDKQKLRSAADALIDGIATKRDPVAIDAVAKQATDEDRKIIERIAAENGNPIAIREHGQ